MANSCLMMRARHVARVITGIFEEQLLPLGLKASQLSLLTPIAYYGPLGRRELGRMMHLDASTLTRNLRVLESNGWVEQVPDLDRRGVRVLVTKAGETLLDAAAPAWEIAQRKATRLLGPSAREALVTLSNSLVHP